MGIIFEVRIPTYHRADLLRRALESLQAQTYPHWIATVYDDASGGDDVVRGLADARISYSRNVRRLGACANIDQCFSPKPFGAGHYGHVLEDDNFLMPGFFALIAKRLDEKPWQLIQANQRIWSKERGLHPETETTRGLWFTAGKIDVIHLRAALLFMEGLSNGGMIWKLDGSCDFQVGPTVQHFGIQEVCRGLLARESFLFIDEALAVFNRMDKDETARGNEDNRSFGRGMQSVRRYIIAHNGAEVIPFVLNDLGEKIGLRGKFYNLLTHSGYPHHVEKRIMFNWFTLKAYLKGLALRVTQPDPCKDFFTELEKNDVLDLGIGPQLPHIEAQRLPETRKKYRSRSLF